MRLSRLRRAALLAGISSLCAPVLIHGQSLDGMKGKVKERVLSNGMKVIVMERHDAPVASFHVYADVGSANESYGITGISHLLEHMAFKGSTTVGTTDYAQESVALARLDSVYEEMQREVRRPRPDSTRLAVLRQQFAALEAEAKRYVVTDEFIDLLRKEGDRSVNAYTSNDATQYINSLPSNRLEFWMAITSDRFLNPVFREFYKERDVVMEERRLSLETRPIGKLTEDFLATAFKAHPYHHTVIGHMSDLQRVTRKDVESYFRTYYIPSNMVVAIVGDVQPEEVFRLAELYFGRIPSGPKPEEPRTEEPEQWGERRVQVVAQSEPILVVGYHRPSIRHDDHFPLDALANIVGVGRSSRLYQEMVKNRKIAIQTGCFNGFPGQKYPNLIAFYAVPAKDHTSTECLQVLDEEIEKLKRAPVTDEELSKYKRMTKKDLLDQMKSNAGMAEMLANAEVLLGDWRATFEQLKRVDAVTAADVQRVANTYLTSRNRTIGEIVPEKGSAQ
ncbi:MAG: insulinase family protein [candidate division KSB1 bacterium]|nr:insulinase family protein [candidate division KSB1 bacterium]MDZ7394024.1 insulinase family protein [candidate division KSB1 bacterium]MDZ7413241.1 insulinase family protein [candidate division KSB1 bacterium]